MRRHFLYRSAALAIVSLAMVLAIAGAGLAADFSADVVNQFGKQSMNGKIYVSGSSYRSETTMNGQTATMIVDGRKKCTYVIDSKTKSYMVVPKASPTPMSAIDNSVAKQATIKKLGTTTIAGQVTEKTLYIPKQKQQGGSQSVMVWRSKKLNWPVRVEMKASGQTAVMQLKNIKMGKPKASLFEVPKGYKKMTMPPPGKAAPMAPRKVK